MRPRPADASPARRRRTALPTSAVSLRVCLAMLRHLASAAAAPRSRAGRLRESSHEMGRVGVGWGRWRLARRLVRPLRPFVDPLSNRLDLIVAERAGRRHLGTEGRTDQAVIETASSGMSGSDIGLRSPAHGVGAAIQPQASSVAGRGRGNRCSAHGRSAVHRAGNRCGRGVGSRARPPSSTRR